MLGKQLYISSSQELREEVAPVVNDPDGYFRQKPLYATGFWTSSWRKETEDSDWVEWCRSEEFDTPDKKQWWLLVPQPDCRIYTIDSFKDFQRCLSEYAYQHPLAEVHHFYKERRILDFEKLAADYDGLHLTEQGNMQTHYSYPEDLNSWDCESTLWFRWCFTAVEKIAVPQPISIDS